MLAFAVARATVRWQAEIARRLAAGEAATIPCPAPVAHVGSDGSVTFAVPGLDGRAPESYRAGR
jgi:hypothetical protein